MFARVVRPARKHGCARLRQSRRSSPWLTENGAPLCPMAHTPSHDQPIASFGGFGPASERASNPAGTAGPQRAKPHQLLVLLVPKAKREGLQAAEEGNRLDLGEDRVGVVTFLQMIIGDERAQMMNMMEPDV